MLRKVKQFLGITERKSTLAQPDEWLIAALGAMPTAAGITVSAEAAMRCPVVYASVKVIAESVAQLPLILYRRTAGGGKERATDHPLYELLHDAPNEWTSAAEFRLDLQIALCLHGNAYAFINRNGEQVEELVQIPSAQVEVRIDTVTMEPSYRVTSLTGVQRDYDRTQILHLRTVGTNPYVGLAPIHQAREAIALSLAMEKHAGRLFGAGARPAGVLEYAKTLGPETLRRLRASFDASHAGSDGSGRTLILEDGMSFRPLQFNSVDLQFLELRRHQVAEIARVFRVPLHMLQDLERITFNNAETMGRQFLAFTLLPWLKLWEQAIRRSLIAPADRGILYAEFLTDDIARADLAARFDAYAKAVTNGILNPNEVRAAENRSPYAGGDEFRVPLNTAPPGTARAA